jgi:CO/xanthine dehydrogenase Mo-binding subunit
MRYGQIMAEYSKLAGTDEHQSDQASLFAPFAGTEGYNPAAYIPYIVGQLLGGMIWGISSAWHEATEIDARNARYVNDNLADYLIPVNADIQDLEVILVPETDDFVNPAGVKGLGELGNVGTAAAVANALYHATGIRFRQLPIRIENLFV